LSTCRHQFSWPRRDDDGANYQVCIHCGTKYSYDWAKMRRIAPLENREGSPEIGHNTLRQCGTKKKAWTPRERRLRHQVPILFRIPGSERWNEGVTENISRSGIAFRSGSPFEIGSILELVFEMPPELAGDQGARVACEGTLLRIEPVAPARKKSDPLFQMACTIAVCTFVPASEIAAAPAE
jgi:hypothetical protein